MRLTTGEQLRELMDILPRYETTAENCDMFRERVAELEALIAEVNSALSPLPAAQNQGEAQSRERWVVVCWHWQDTTLEIHGERTGHIASGIDEDAAHAIVNAHNQGLPPIVAASTGQEVKP